MEAYENHIAKCSRPRVRTGIRARFLLWRRRPAPSKQRRPIATHGRDGSSRITGHTPTTGRSPIGRTATNRRTDRSGTGCNSTGCIRTSGPA